MNEIIERRHPGHSVERRRPSPAVLALLEMCGVEIRASDRTALAQWRAAAAGTGDRGDVQVRVDERRWPVDLPAGGA